jgi:XRE family transcriptional regulator, regulator of sulfur utilization
MNRQNAGMPPKAMDARLGPAIRRLREAQGLTQEDFAQRAGLTMSTVNATERSRTNPTWTTVLIFAEGLGLTVAELAKEIEEEA